MQKPASGFIDLANARQMSAKEFKQAIKERSERSTSLILLLQTANQSVGNLQYYSGTIAKYPNVERFPIAVTDYQGEPTVKLVIATRVDTNFGKLTIGMFDENQQLEEMFVRVSVVSLIVATLITLLAGLLFNRQVLQRVKEIGKLTEKVKKGHLKTRLPVSKNNNEFDAIAKQINQMLDDIDELVNSVASVSDNIAHDLRTPLSRIRIGIENYQSDQQADEDSVCWRENMLAEIDRLMDTFEAMLELTRLEKGVQLIDKQDCDLEKICRDVVDLVEPLADEKHQQLITDIAGATMIRGDANLLFRAVFNLMQNAVKYTPEAGKIQLRLKGNTLQIADNGEGIPEQEFDKVFQRLYRLDSSRSGEGFGMGLAIVKAIVEWHQGSIELKNNKPGLCVTLEFNCH